MKKNPIELLFELNGLDRVKFISIRNYKNAAGELSNYTLIAAYGYGKAVQKDIERLSGVCYDGYKEVARQQMLEVLIRNQQESTCTPASQAQRDAYVKLGQNSRVHIDSRTIRVWAFLRQKTILKPVASRPVNKGMMERLKDEIKEELRLSTRNFRQFKLENIREVAMNGQTLKIVA